MGTKTRRDNPSSANLGAFGSTVSPERFHLDEAAGKLLRTVVRKDPDAVPVTSELGGWDPSIPLDDLRSAADLAYLRRRSFPPAPDRGREMRAVDLFSGCGAMSLGVAEACRALGYRFRSAGAFDVDRRALNIYGANFEIADLSPTDLRTLLVPDIDAPFSSDESQWIDRVGRVDFLLAGPPCQGHSNLNNHTRRDDPKNALYFLVARAAKLLRPRWILVENVIAVRHDKSDVVHRTQVALEDLGYVTRDGIVDLSRIGVPQKRKRHVLVGRLADGKDEEEIESSIEQLVAPYVTRVRGVGWAIGDLLNVSRDHFIDREKIPDPVTQARIDYLFDSGQGLYDLPDSMRPECHRNGHSYKSVYGRMKWEEPAPTITGGFDTMGQGRFVHPKRRRTLTPHEGARLQFIPDFFDFGPASEFSGPLVEIIGNAVPPKLSYVLALEMMR